MRKLSVLFIIVVILGGCKKPAVATGAPSTGTSESDTVEQVGSDTTIIPVEDLSLDSLVGKWLFLDSEAEVDPSGDYLLIVKKDNEYKGVLVYQKSTSPCILKQEMLGFFVISGSGEKYKVSRIESMYKKENNGIGLALIVPGVEDISLGFFQREDVLKRLENE